MLTEEEREQYESRDQMEEGSAVAQMFAQVDGVRNAVLERGEALVGRDPDVDWHVLITEISAALKEFFL